jgi:hypothetical protein
MSLIKDAHASAFSLATSRMAAIVIFQAGDGTHSVMPASEYDGDTGAIVHEIDPFAPWPGQPGSPKRKSAANSVPGAAEFQL